MRRSARNSLLDVSKAYENRRFGRVWVLKNGEKSQLIRDFSTVSNAGNFLHGSFHLQVPPVTDDCRDLFFLFSFQF